MELTTVWFALIAFFWVGYLVLEGFDFGVGMLLPVLGRDDRERRVLINTIGPVWDGNEVWLVVAVGATFAAFPEWYATMLSGFYLPLFAILVTLILRGLAFEYRGKRSEASWKRRWDAAIVAGSVVPALLWGVLLSAMVGGLPVDAEAELVGGPLDILSPYALLGGVTVALLCLTHGAVFVALKTAGEIRVRANRLATRVGILAVVSTTGFVTLTVRTDPTPAVVATAGGAVLTLVAALLAARADRDGWAFLGTAVSVGLVVVTMFVAVFPYVMPSTLEPAYGLTTLNAASSAYTLQIVSVTGAVLTPLVLVYQGWTYWVFRKRLRLQDIPA